MEPTVYDKAIVGGRVATIDRGILHTITVTCPDCARYLYYLSPDLVHCPGCDAYYELGIRKIESKVYI